VGTLVFALIIIFALQAFINGTITGRAMQATAQNPESATVLGINVQRMVLYTFAINAALATAAALLVTPIYLAKFDMGLSLGMKAFLAAIIGGFNNSRGALLGGLIVGVLENWAAAYVSPAYKDAVALVLFFGVIMLNPNGLLGTVETRKV
jgi:branched-chain amino acid transport system permease protein